MPCWGVFDHPSTPDKETAKRTAGGHVGFCRVVNNLGFNCRTVACGSLYKPRCARFTFDTRHLRVSPEAFEHIRYACWHFAHIGKAIEVAATYWTSQPPAGEVKLSCQLTLSRIYLRFIKWGRPFDAGFPSKGTGERCLFERIFLCIDQSLSACW